MSGSSLGNGKVIQSSDKALRVKLDTGDVVWIPKALIHDDSEVYDDDEGREGDVVVKTWWAEQEGLI